MSLPEAKPSGRADGRRSETLRVARQGLSLEQYKKPNYRYRQWYLYRCFCTSQLHVRRALAARYTVHTLRGNDTESRRRLLDVAVGTASGDLLAADL